MDIAVELTSRFRLQFISYAVISVFVVLWCRYKWKRRAFDRLAAKLTGPPSYPIIGSALEILGTPQQVMEKLVKNALQFGPEPFKIGVPSYFAVALMKPEDVQIVLNSSKALNKGYVYDILKNMTGDGLFTAPVDKWRVHRRLISPVFNANLLNQFLPVFNQKNEIMIKNLNKEVGKIQPFDLWNYIAPNAFDTICQTMMGYNINAQSKIDTEFMKTLTIVSELEATRVYKPWLYPDFVFSIYLKLKGMQNIFKTLRKFPNKVIKEKKKAYAQWKITNKTNGVKHSTNGGEEKQFKVFLDTLLELKEAGVNLSDKDIEDEVVTMFFGGIETGAVTVCFCLLLLAIHPNIQEFDEHATLASSLSLSLNNLGWISVDVTNTVREWYGSSGKHRLRFHIDCSGCGSLVSPVLFHDTRQVNEWENPFLMVYTDPTVTRRVRRRALDCSLAMRGQCCKQRFYIKFQEIGWDSWIIAPGGYYANYCRGDCGGVHRTPDTYLNLNTQAIEDYRKAKHSSIFQPCCAPVKFSSMSLIYFTDDGNIIKRDLPKMVIDECGCP